MVPGEIYLAQFPFGDAPVMKLRPVLLLTGAVGPVPEVLVAYISSVIPGQLLPSDMMLDPALPEFRSTHLKTASTLRLHKLATIHCKSLARYLGKLEADARLHVKEKLNSLLGL
ncbi:MAG: type II toxin-antitoxin system PemK/MazF family toxin [Terriglobia bacterium]